MNPQTREKIIVRTSILGIIANLFLAVFKAALGLLSHSIAITLDAVNNLSDALSSIITIIGTKLSNRLPDKKHPLGHGRIEYLSAMLVAGIVLYAGITSAVESVKKILHPQKADYSAVTLIIIAVAVLVKIFLGMYVKSQGKKVNSGALIASGSDASFDAILSASVLASALIYLTTGVSLEALVAAIISIVIIKSGIEMMTETLNEIIGVRADPKEVQKIKAIVKKEKMVRGVYDLVMYNYGPNRDMVSLHIEVPDTISVNELDNLTRRIETAVYEQTGTVVVAVGIYSFNTGDDEAARLRNEISKQVTSHEWAIQVHGFYVDLKTKDIRFDVVLNFEIDPQEGLDIIKQEMTETYPDYSFVISPDIDISVTE